jgi:hypothetical protein
LRLSADKKIRCDFFFTFVTNIHRSNLFRVTLMNK